MMKIDRPSFSRKGDRFECRFDVYFGDARQTLWYRLQEKYSSFVSSRSDAALVALLIPAMERGEDIYIDGTVSERLYYTCSRSYQHLVRTMMPEKLSVVEIDASDVQPATHRGAGVATGFSGGIDSFCVLADHYYASDVPNGFSVSHLLYNNVGSHGSGGEELFKKRYERVSPIAERIGLPFVPVNSNVASFYDHNVLPYQRTHTPRNVSVPLLMQSKFGRFLYASAYSYEEIDIGKNCKSAHTDSVALPLLSNQGFDALSTGSEYTRIEKTFRVSEIEDSYDFLDVCVNNEEAGNCSGCWKCTRTLITLDVANVLDRYEKIFDLDMYYNNRELYIARKILSEDILDSEVVDCARNNNFNISISVYMYVFLLYINRILR